MGVGENVFVCLFVGFVGVFSWEVFIVLKLVCDTSLLFDSEICGQFIHAGMDAEGVSCVLNEH